MRILINATSFGTRPSGARSRFESIYPLFFKAQADMGFTLLISKDYALPSKIQACNNVHAIQLPISSNNKIFRRIFFALLPLLYLIIKKFDVIEDLSQPPTLLRAEYRLLTIHDIRRLEISSSLTSHYFYRASLWICWLLKYRVITVSETMAKCLSDHYPESMIDVIENGVPAAFLEGETKAKSPKSLSGNYILAVGHMEPRKNYVGLIKAFVQLSNKFSHINLIIVGKNNGSEDSIRSIIEEYGQQDRIELRANVSDAELIDLYRSTLFLVFPSLYEGFGIPLLEAMSTYCPLVISDIEVFHEIAGDSAVYFNPNNVEDISSAITSLLENKHLRTELAAKGKQRLEKYRTAKLSHKLGTLYSSFSEKG